MAVVLVILLRVVLTVRSDVGPKATDFDVGDPVGEAGPMAPGQLVWMGTNTLILMGDTNATLIDLTPLGLPAGVARDALFMPIAGTQGALGEAPDLAVPAANRHNARPMKGVIVTRADAYFQLLIRFVLPGDGVTVHGYLLTYMVDGETRQVFIPRSQHLCTDGSLAPACDAVRPYD